MARIEIVDADRKVVEERELSESIFSAEVKPHLLHTVVVAQMAFRSWRGEKTVEAEGERQSPGRNDKVSSLERRRDNFWPEATRLQPEGEQESDEVRTPLGSQPKNAREQHNRP
jgi:hypothetical protein